MKRSEGPGRTERRGSWGPRKIGTGNCWNCGKPGHFSRNCPELCYNQGGASIESKGLSLVPRRYQRLMYSLRAGTLRGTQVQLELYISSKLEGVDVTFLVDTGSKITILVEKICANRRPELEIGKYRMILADGSAKPFVVKGHSTWKWRASELRRKCGFQR